MKKLKAKSLEAVHTHTSNLKKKDKKELAITLISLIITIIILLILAGITIVTLTGENGSISRAKQATEEYSISQAKETLELAITNLRIDKEEKGESLIKEDLPKINNNEIDVGNTENFPVEVICQKYKFSVDENYIITYVGEAEGTIITYTTEPEGYTNKDEIKILIKVSNPKGIKTIEYPDGDKLQAVDEKTEVGIDYKVSKNGIYTFKIIDNENKEVTKNIVIDLIDKLPPIDFTPEVAKDGGNIIITENAQDAEATEESTKSGIDYYEYHLIDKNNVDTKYETNKIENLAIGTYQVYVIAYDKAGNSRQSNIKEIKVTIQYKDVATGYSHVLVLDEEGNIYSWGSYSNGNLGLTNFYQYYEPEYIQMKEKVKFKKIASKSNHNVALDSEGKLWYWGDYMEISTRHTYSNVPVQVQSDETIKFIEIATGEYSNLALDEEGNIWSWGNNRFGQLGNGTVSELYTRIPQRIEIEENIKFKKISGGCDSNLALDKEGNIWSWGRNVSGELGDGTTTDSYVPKKIQIEGNVKFKEIKKGTWYSMAIDEEGNIWSWGRNGLGQLGDGTTVDSYIPKKIQTDQNVRFSQISLYSDTSMAIDEKGNLWEWGCNSNGEFGDGTTVDSYIPKKIQIDGDIKLKKIEAGYFISFAIDEDRNLWSWGYNNSSVGLLGDKAKIYTPHIIN